jgi:hypothetical protein
MKLEGVKVLEWYFAKFKVLNKRKLVICHYKLLKLDFCHHKVSIEKITITK